MTPFTPGINMQSVYAYSIWIMKRGHRLLHVCCSLTIACIELDLGVQIMQAEPADCQQTSHVLVMLLYGLHPMLSSSSSSYEYEMHNNYKQ